MSEEKYHPLKSPYHPLKHLAALRNLDRDDIPAEMIHSYAPDNRFKVRGGWWVGVKADLYYAIREGFVPELVIENEINEFIKQVTQLKFGDDTPASRRTAEEIAWANEFIDKVLEQTGYANVLLDLSSLEIKVK